MIIRSAQALPPAAFRQNTLAPKTAGTPDPAPGKDADKVSISSEAAQKAAESPYRVDGAPTLLSAMNLSTYKMPEALVKEMAVRANEEAVRAGISAQYAQANRYETVGQILVDGKLVADVDEAGGYGFIGGGISGLSEATLDPRARLEEIARALQDTGKVEVRYANFLPGLGGVAGPAAPESLLPAFTARDVRDIFREAIDAARREAQPRT